MARKRTNHKKEGTKVEDIMMRTMARVTIYGGAWHSLSYLSFTIHVLNKYSAFHLTWEYTGLTDNSFLSLSHTV